MLPSIYIIIFCSFFWPFSIARDILHDHTFNNTLLLDPNNDAWFESISEFDLIQNWSYDDGTTVPQKMKRLQKLHQAFSLKVDIKLVGFDSDGGSDISIDTTQLTRYLDRAIEDLRTYTLGLYVGKEIPFRTSIKFQVSKSQKILNTKIIKALQDQIDMHPDAVPPVEDPNDTEERINVITIPVSAVDGILDNDFTKTSVSHTIYILNPKKPTVNGKEIYYSYIDAESSSCNTAMWLGTDKRYAWIDLSAGPVDFGPRIGEGGFDTSLFPNVGSFATGVRTVDEFLSALVDIIYDTSSILITPSVYTFPVKYDRTIIVNLVFISDRADLDSEAQFKSQWRTMVEQLESMAITGQEIRIQPHFMSFADCELCVLAYTHSLKAQASKDSDGEDLETYMRMLYDEDVPIQMERYLDSSEMHDWLEHFNQKYKEDMFVDDNEISDKRTVTAFIYDLSTSEVILFDRENQAVPFRDIVVAVQTETHKAAVLDLLCNDEPVYLNPSDASRSTLAALLSTIWGVAPTHLEWDDLLRKKENNHLWSTALTPFGYLTKSQKLSFALRDSGVRNMLLSEAFKVLDILKLTLAHLEDHALVLDNILHYDDFVMFIRRWNVFHYKIENALNLMSLSDYENAIFYMRSAQHDANSVHEILHESVRNLKPIIKCPEPMISKEFWTQNWDVITPLLLGFIVVGIAIRFFFRPKSKVKHN